ncbi:MAG: hypothetical protein SWH78_02115 [Thermodesulfobacteriota bacterium]|nr:hypothetical protein [Thermodesulfobacteriota bacterium]
MALKRLNYLVLLVIIGAIWPVALWARGNIAIDVKTVLASQKSEDLDPRLSSLVKELQSVFRYSSYRLLGEDRVDLTMKETGTVFLPGNRVLKMTPMKIAGDRIELKLVILKKKKQIFETLIKLLNHTSLTVGGPKHQDGVLLFNISASF